MSEREGPLSYLTEMLDDLARRDRLRKRPEVRDDPAHRFIDLCSNDYLGYGARAKLRPFVEQAARSAWPGAGAARLVSGEHQAHLRLERAIAEWLGCDDALTFTSGYAANVGTIAALAGPDDLIVSDALNHASIIDGCRLSRATIAIARHRDVNAMRQLLATPTKGRRWLITESYFSMDGDIAPLSDLREVCDEYGAALIVDEAHALGIFGSEGRGLAAEQCVRPDVLVGTLGKAFAAQGAFVAGSRALCAWLWNRARSFVFSTGLSPLLAEIAVGALGLARADEEARDELRRYTLELREICRRAGLAPASTSVGPIIPIIFGSDQKALHATSMLKTRGIVVQAIRPPTVPEGTARLRLTASASLSQAQLQRFSEAVAAGLG